MGEKWGLGSSDPTESNGVAGVVVGDKSLVGVEGGEWCRVIAAAGVGNFGSVEMMLSWRGWGFGFLCVV